MVLYGMKTTRDINIDTMILHGKAVKKSTKKSLVVFDMPHKTYTNKYIAYKNALRTSKRNEIASSLSIFDALKSASEIVDNRKIYY